MSQQPKNVQDPLPESRSGPSGTVLLVDDNQDILDIMRMIIERFTHFKVLMAHTGNEALEVIASHSIDVIVLDDSMPGMGGQECFKIIRQRSIYVPVIFLTGKATDQIRDEQLARGAFDFLEKPVRAKDLILLLNEAHATMERIRTMLVRRNT